MKRILSLLILMSLPLTANAQWTKTSSQLLGPIGQNIGGMAFKAGKAWVGTTALWESTDSGKTWVRNSLITGGNVAHIYFLDGLHGLVTTHSGKVYKTMDGGNSWTTILSTGSATSAAFLNSTNTIIATQFQPGNIRVSHDGGTNWSTIPNNNWIREVIPGQHGDAYILSGDWPTGEHIWVTHDSGYTWVEQPGRADADSYSFDIDRCSSQYIYIVNEEYSVTAGYDGRSEVFVSSNEGISWSVTADYASKYFAGSVSVSPNAVFVQTVSEAGAGLLRSTDHGQTWQNIAGPSSSGDTRLITAIDDNNLIGADVSGNIWITNNSGGDSLSLSSGRDLPSASSNPFYPVSACFDTSAWEYLSIGCAQFRLDSAIILYDNAGVFHVDPRLTLPRTIDYFGSDSLRVIFHPGGQSGTFTAELHLVGRLLGTGARFDTIIDLSASSTSPGPQYPAVRATPFSLTPDCELGDGYTFVRIGCSLFDIDSVKIENDTANAFRLDPTQKYPFTLGYNGSDSIHVIFHPDHRVGGFGARLHIYGKMPGSGISLDTVIQLLAGSVPSIPIFYSNANRLLWKSVSECASGDTTITFVNKGCDTVTVDSVQGFGGGSLVLQLQNLPRRVPPGGSIQIRVHFVPQGLQQDSLVTTIFYSSPGFSDSVHVPVYAQASPAAPSLSSSLSKINFGAGYSCDELDSVVYLKNTGCDSLTLTSLSTGKGNFTIDPMPTLPIRLARGDSIAVHVRYHPSNVVDTQTIFYTGINGAKTTGGRISLFGSIKTTSLTTSLDSAELRCVAQCTSDDTTITLDNPGCDMIVITSASISPAGDIVLLLGASLPIIIPPHSKLDITVRFSASNQEDVSATLTLDPYVKGLQQPRIEIPLHGSATSPVERLELSDTSLGIDSLSICKTDTLRVKLYNRGCAYIKISADQLTGDPEFVLLSGKDSVEIAPDDSVVISLLVLPQTKGTKRGTLAVRFWNSQGYGGARDTSILLQAEILGGSGILSSSLSSADLGKLTTCYAHDTTITLKNEGCDTLTIDSAHFSNSYFILQPNVFPLRIPPGSSFRWNISPIVDTTGHALGHQTNLSFASDAIPPLSSIPLSYSIGYPSQLDFKLVPLTGSAPADTPIYYDIRALEDVGSYGVSKVSFILNANEDILSYAREESPNSVAEYTTSSGGVASYHFSVTGSPVQRESDGRIARLWFVPYLTLSTHTTISLDSFALNPSDPSFEECTAFARARQDTTFELIGACGEGYLQSELAQKPIVLNVRNAGRISVLHVSSPINFVGRLVISNVVGAIVTDEAIMVRAGGSEFAIPLEMPEGPYFAAIEGPSGFHARTMFIHLRP